MPTLHHAPRAPRAPRARPAPRAPATAPLRPAAARAAPVQVVAPVDAEEHRALQVLVQAGLVTGLRVLSTA